jgi:hypothetical protein
MARENNQNRSLAGNSRNLLNLDVKTAARKEAASEDQSLEVQSKPIFDPFNSEPLNPRTLLITQDDSACSDNVVEKTDTASELSRH